MKILQKISTLLSKKNLRVNNWGVVFIGSSNALREHLPEDYIKIIITTTTKYGFRLSGSLFIDNWKKKGFALQLNSTHQEGGSVITPRGLYHNSPPQYFQLCFPKKATDVLSQIVEILRIALKRNQLRG